MRYICVTDPKDSFAKVAFFAVILGIIPLVSLLLYFFVTDEGFLAFIFLVFSIILCILFIVMGAEMFYFAKILKEIDIDEMREVTVRIHNKNKEMMFLDDLNGK
ncbi:MAG: hypothetical protein FWG41_02660 [Methanomassiliicoccaceae archaeon]|nr:hypothetical protein [Methanomassiliicoccaceae archaeon]